MAPSRTGASAAVVARGSSWASRCAVTAMGILPAFAVLFAEFRQGLLGALGLAEAQASPRSTAIRRTSVSGAWPCCPSAFQAGTPRMPAALQRCQLRPL
ncbi:MAG: hypothetical protein WAK76_20955, partial [Trebonia sp.]